MIGLLNLFILTNILLAIATAIAGAIYYFSNTPFRAQLKLNYTLLSLIAITVVIASLMQTAPAVKIIKTSHFVQTEMKLNPVPAAIRVDSNVATPLKTATPVVLIALLFFAFAYISFNLLKLVRIFRGTYLFKRVYSVRVLLAPNVCTPFSFWLPFRQYVVLPYALATSPNKIRLCTAHELQHHRQGDTIWIYALLAVRILFFMNPAIYVWNRLITEIQEFSCDEVLLGRQNVAREDYIGCLIEVAENSLRQSGKLECATRLCFVKRQNLKRRIEFMLNAKKKNHGWLPALVVGSAIIFSATAFAGKNVVEEQRFTAKQVEESVSSFDTRVTMDGKKEVIKALNSFLNDPIKKKFYREGLERYIELKPEIEKMAQSLGVPNSVLAIGLLESGFQDWPPQYGNLEKSTGMWQMIAKTAKVLGLTVNEQVDDRRDFLKATDAALRYLVMNKARFSSWELSILAYNSGEKAVEAAMAVTGSRNPWIVKTALHEETQRYYTNWIIAAMVMSNPTWLDR